jgi:hypothetical protein
MKLKLISIYSLLIKRLFRNHVVFCFNLFAVRHFKTYLYDYSRFQKNSNEKNNLL